MKTCEITTKVCERTLVFQQVKVFLKVFENAQPQVYDLFHSGRAWHWWEKNVPVRSSFSPSFFHQLPGAHILKTDTEIKEKLQPSTKLAWLAESCYTTTSICPEPCSYFPVFCSQCTADSAHRYFPIMLFWSPDTRCLQLILKVDSELNEMRPKNICNFPIM